MLYKPRLVKQHQMKLELAYLVTAVSGRQLQILYSSILIIKECIIGNCVFKIDAKLDLDVYGISSSLWYFRN